MPLRHCIVCYSLYTRLQESRSPCDRYVKHWRNAPFRVHAISSINTNCISRL